MERYDTGLYYPLRLRAAFVTNVHGTDETGIRLISVNPYGGMSGHAGGFAAVNLNISFNPLNPSGNYMYHLL
jgi:hypothetical protein